jgi:phosphonate transport system ATP-binding protein
VKSSAWALEGVSVRFGSVQALSGITLQIAPGDIVGFVGPSGSGKTTLLRVLQTAVTPTTGSIRYGDLEYAQLSSKKLQRHRAELGFVPQSHALVPNQNVLYNVLTGRLGRSSFLGSARSLLFPSRGEIEKVYRVLERVGIPEKIYQRADQLSGGQQQRVAVARALYQNPTVILADEPVSNMDPARARSTLEFLTRVSREEKLTLCLSLHDLELALEYCPRLVGLRKGTIHFDSAPDALSRSDFEALYNLSSEEILEDG